MAAEGRDAWRRACSAVELAAVLHFSAFYVLFYCEKPGAFKNYCFLGWGLVWEPFFFFSSGFKFTLAQLTEGVEPEPLGPFMIGKLLKVYPVYALGHAIKVILKLLLPSAHSFGGRVLWHTLPASLLFWHTRWNDEVWLLRPLLVHWLFWRLTYSRFARLSAQQCWLGVVPCAISIPFRVALFKRGILGLPQLGFGSLTMLPIFIAGVLLGRIVHLRCGKPWLALSLGGGRKVGLGGAFSAAVLVFLLVVCPSSHARMFFRLGVLVPFQALFLMSVTSDQDLLASPLRWRPLAVISRWRYAVAVMFNPLCFVLFRLGVQRWTWPPLGLLMLLLLPAYFGLGALAMHVAERFLVSPFKRLFERIGDFATSEVLPPKKRPTPLDNFAGMEFLAVMHILGFHVIHYSLKDFWHNEQNFMGWGGSWDPFFLCISGYKITVSQLSKKEPWKAEPVVPYMLRRVMRVYPLFLFTVFLKGIQKLTMADPSPTQHWKDARLITWRGLPDDLVLNVSFWNGPAWFIKNTIYHSFFFNLLTPLLMRLPVRLCWCGLVCSLLASLVRIYVPKPWLKNPKDEIYLIWNPYLNFPMMICGVFLARVASDSRFCGLLPFTVRGRRVYLGGLVALALHLGVLANIRSIYSRGPVKVGLLLPLQAMLARSLSAPDDLLGQLFRQPLFKRLGFCSYALTITQDVSLTVLKRYWLKGWKHVDLEAFFFVIVPYHIAIGYTVAHYAEPFMVRNMNRIGRWILGVLALLGEFLLGDIFAAWRRASGHD